MSMLFFCCGLVALCSKPSVSAMSSLSDVVKKWFYCQAFPPALGNAMRDHIQYAALEIGQIVVTYSF